MRSGIFELIFLANRGSSLFFFLPCMIQYVRNILQMQDSNQGPLLSIVQIYYQQLIIQNVTGCIPSILQTYPGFSKRGKNKIKSICRTGRIFVCTTSTRKILQSVKKAQLFSLSGFYLNVLFYDGGGQFKYIYIWRLFHIISLSPLYMYLTV